MILPVRIFDDPILRRKARKVETITDEIRGLAQDMIETMIRFDGIGLAANQVGKDLRIITIDPRPCGFNIDPYAIINPEIISSEDIMEGEEGCLSLPGVYRRIKRAKKVKVAGADIDGREIVVQGEELMSRVLQHEIDHINGNLIIFYPNGEEI
ncbi:MAG TPA: peptide deformylase [bacterium (Candidatus Stahlbacteria)]|nr:peptide deformylase [Candidatus Stahlbacteria bacterium]